MRPRRSVAGPGKKPVNMTTVGYYEAPFVQQFRPDAAVAAEDEKDGSLAWIGLVLMGFSSIATVALLGWFVTALIS